MLPQPLQQWLVLAGQGALPCLEVAGAGDAGRPWLGEGVARQLCCPALAGPTPDLRVAGGIIRWEATAFAPILPQMTGHTSICDSCHGPVGLWSCEVGLLGAPGNGRWWMTPGLGQSLLRKWAPWQRSVRQKPVSRLLEALRSGAAQPP